MLFIAVNRTLRVTPLKSVVDIPLKPSKTLANRIENLGPDYSQFAEELDPADSFAEVLPEAFQSLDQTSTSPLLHVIVQLPTLSKWQHVNSRYRSANPILLLPLSLADNVFVFPCDLPCVLWPRRLTPPHTHCRASFW